MSLPSFAAGFEIEARFQLAKPLATGGMAQAFLAWDTVNQCPVVVKHPQRGLLDDALFQARFSREVEALRSLPHPHIVPLIHTGVHDDVPYLVMPFMAGGSLAERIVRPQGRPKGSSKPSSLYQWLPAIADALDFAHANGIVHRDVKPANVFFNASRVSFLGDFGIVKPLEQSLASDDSLTRTNVALGTLLYMAPERFRTDARPSGRADQYSLAISVYEALAGRRPFLGQTHHVAVEHMTSPPPPLPVHSEEPSPESLRRALERALSKNPTDRFSTCTEFAAAILSDVAAPQANDGVAELMCPACRRVIPLKLDLECMKGHCSRCHAPLVIGPRCEWLWPADVPRRKVASGAVPAGSGVDKVRVEPPNRSKRRRRAMIAGVAITIGSLMAALVVGFPQPSSHTSPDQSVEQLQPTSPAGGVLAALEAPASPTHAPKEQSIAPTPVAAEDELIQGLTTVAPGIDLPPDLEEAALDDAAVHAVVEAPSAAEPVPPDVPMAADGETAHATTQQAMPPKDGPAPDGEESAPAQAFPNQAVLDIDWVVIDDPGNDSDENGRGKVDRPFLIGRYEVTNEEYCLFLNGSDVGRRNHCGVADGPSRPNNPTCPEDYDRGIFRLKGPEGDDYRYQVAPLMHDKPVVNLCWSDAARYANWLHNGGCDGADTESGAYELNGVGKEEFAAKPASPQARVWVPSLDEWYKAAFSKVVKGRCIGYWRFATASDTQPTAANADDFGIGDASEKPGGNRANITAASRWPAMPPAGIKPAVWKKVGSVTSVGSNGKAGDFGAYDMAGNAAELVVQWTSPTALTAAVVGGDCNLKDKAADLSSAGLVAHHPTNGEPRKAGLRLACVADAAVAINPAREIRPLGLIDAAVEAAHDALAYVAETPSSRIVDIKVKAMLDKLGKISDAKLPADASRIVAETRRLLGTVLRDSHDRKDLRNGVDALSQAYPMVALLGREAVREIANIDRKEIENRFQESYEQHQDDARRLLKSCETLRKSLRADPLSPKAPPQ